ncbi:MAG: HD domain-containing protein [Alphaproteobacteria bacterium]|nr:HD domain-containing protein [Alphaproteobacteria bacterium]
MQKERLKYTKIFFEDILPKIELVTNQSRYGYHGLSHTIQVAMFALDIAQHINQDPLPALLAAALHDCARTNDAWCVNHGPDAVPIGKKFLAENYPDISTPVIEQILYAVKNHTIGRNAQDGVSACLWDGDRIRLSWTRGYKPDCFSTDRGKEIASLTPAEQQKYIAKQEEFLIVNNIRTRQQIDFDKTQDLIQNKTTYKTRTR